MPLSFGPGGGTLDFSNPVRKHPMAAKETHWQPRVPALKLIGQNLFRGRQLGSQFGVLVVVIGRIVVQG